MAEFKFKSQINNVSPESISEEKQVMRFITNIFVLNVKTSSYPLCVIAVFKIRSFQEHRQRKKEIKGPWASVVPLSFCFMEVMDNEF